jgi:hypothetical protein
MKRCTLLGSLYETHCLSRPITQLCCVVVQCIGIDVTNDPLLQGRLFSYIDTQITRLGGPNFHEIPINRPLCPYRNFQRVCYSIISLKPVIYLPILPYMT